MSHAALTTPTYGAVGQLKVSISRVQTVHKIWSLYVHPFRRYFMGCKVINLVTWPWPRLFQGELVFRRLALDIADNHTKFDDSRVSHSSDI